MFVRPSDLRSVLVASSMLLGSLGTVHAQETSAQIDLNRATREQIETLPVSPAVARNIWEHREFVDYYASVLDLLHVEGMTPELLTVVKPFVLIAPVEASEERRRKDELFYRFEWWEGAEGADESLVELYKDLALDPVDINTASLLDIQNLQNASPVDAVAIVRYREQVGEITNRSELRRAGGLSGWGYSNIRNFVTYDEHEEDDAWHGAYSLRLETTSYFADVEDLLRVDRDPGQGTNDNWWDRLELDNPSPAVSQKLKLDHRNVSFGLVTTRRLGEDDLFDTKKGFVSVEDVELGPVRVDNFVAGNYAVSWGQGVIMENTDFFSARKSGYNFGKRYDGVLGDLSRTDQSALRGAAGEVSWGPLRGLGFYSDDEKDAVLNRDGSVNQLIWLSPRISDQDLIDAGLPPMRDQVHEETFGGNLRYNFRPGCWLGAGGYESRYDREFDPKWDPRNPTDKHPLVDDDDEDNFVAQDGEIASSFRSDGRFRRIYGLDFQWVHRDLSVQGEYAELEQGGDVLKLGDDPSALVLNAFVQKENLTFLTVYRDYDLAFDNPYQRSFSNYERFKGTMFEDNFRLTDPIYGMIYENAAQPQAERGFYMNMRYRWLDPLITTIEWDTWRRQGDMSKYSRMVGRVEYRVLFPLRFKLRHKYQNRELGNFRDATIFDNQETIAELEYRLSRFDELQFRYGTSHVKWPPRGRLQGEVEANGLNPISGNNASPATWWSARITHQTQNERLKFDGEASVYEGFWWFFEKNTFRVVDGNGFRTWVEVTDRASDDLTVRLRYSRDNQIRNTAIDVRQFNSEVGEPIDVPDSKQTTSYYRIQMDYTF
jgi:DNA uptake protein ComE-like DNA-binding protein